MWLDCLPHPNIREHSESRVLGGLGLNYLPWGHVTIKSRALFKIQSTPNSNLHAAFHFSSSFFPPYSHEWNFWVHKCCSQHSFFFHFYNCCAFTKQDTDFAQQSNAQLLFYLLSLKAGQPWNLSEMFLAWTHRGLAPCCGNPSRIQVHYVLCQYRCCQLPEVQPCHWFRRWRSFCIKMMVTSIM